VPDRLYRSRRERVIGGVAGGIAEALHIDPTIVRVAWVLLAFATNGLLVLVYFVLLFVLPEAPDEPEAQAIASSARSVGGGTAAASNTRTTSAAAGSPTRSSRSFTDGRSGALVVGAILVLVGGYFLVRRYLPSIDLAASWPIIAVGLGIILVVAALRPGGRSR
jgi:phage shock protein C